MCTISINIYTFCIKSVAEASLALLRIPHVLVPFHFAHPLQNFQSISLFVLCNAGKYSILQNLLSPDHLLGYPSLTPVPISVSLPLSLSVLPSTFKLPPLYLTPPLLSYFLTSLLDPLILQILLSFPEQGPRSSS